MKAAGFVTYATDLDNPNFAAVAEALGIFARRVERSEYLPDAVAEVLAHDGPALLDVVTERQELSMPPAVTAEQVKGFALYAIRTVMSGRGDELLDLARANWRQLLYGPGPCVRPVPRHAVHWSGSCLHSFPVPSGPG